ncbi:sensor histidine kinase [Actinoplanes teichomyceticus]|uniref:histidine kinase n=1 Tax=Actinoplanes teichomyceticus TaxID=1867 RepID=A0A561WC40_ACTTI|nr:histidine kinase [Actinoplanes teichomyceticus]TWG21432.1 signal transduction histidine kinase [Actinoplanes teichomyceticus]GIF16594.1 two-component sensor histidine kinase [Actinoplanes teichomyceticus]
MGLGARWRGSTWFQDAGTAAGTFLAGLAFNLIGLTDIWSLPQPRAVAGWPAWWHTVPLAAGCLAMLGKRRHPVPALVAGTVAMVADLLLGGSVALVLVLFELLFSVGLFASGRARTAVGSAVFVAVGTISVVTGLAVGEFRMAVFMALQLTTLLCVPLWWAANIRQQRQLGRLDAERTAREAVVAERAAMARDLHDVIAAHLSTTAIHSGAALARPPDPERDRATLREVRTSSLAALEEMRSMIMLLRADDATPDAALPGGLDRLPGLVAAATAGGLRVETRIREIPQVSAAVAHAVHRIVREALTNAAKHAPGSEVCLEVHPAGDAVQVTVTNAVTRAGAVDHHALSSGAGLISIRERATLLGGELTAGPDGGHFRVRATLPLHPAGSAR